MTVMTRARFLRASAGATPAVALPCLAGGQSTSHPTMRTRPIPSGREALPVIGCGTYVGFDQAPGIRQMENSFRLLRTDRIDLMQIHDLLDWRIHLATLRERKARGRIRDLGITHYGRRSRGNEAGGGDQSVVGAPSHAPRSAFSRFRSASRVYIMWPAS